MTRIALIGLGEVGALLAADLCAHADLSGFDLRFAHKQDTLAQKIRAIGVRTGADHADAARNADLIISAVTAAQTVAAAGSAALGLSADAFYLDLNSASPGAKAEAAAMINAAGGRYVEAAVMSPFPPKRCATPILIGGPHANAFAPLGQKLGFSGLRVFSDQYGQASAAKLCRSVMVKGVEALLLESLLTARHYRIEDTVIASLSDLFPGCDWTTLSKYMISRAIEHGARRSEEMHEAARTVEESGLAPLMSVSTAARQAWANDFADALEAATLPELLDAVRSQMSAP